VTCSDPLVGQPRTITANPAPPPRAATIDDLLGKLADIQAKKAALDRAEKETVTLLKEKLKQQQERLRKLGVLAEDCVQPPCNTTGAVPAPTAPVSY
jgi:hypothetical protein